MADLEARIDLGIAGLGPAEHIGRGGFADVYRAEQLSLRRTVAIKVLRAQATDPDAEARFERECHAIGAVSDHPHIVGVHEGGFTRNGRAYLVMEYLPGGSLYDRIQQAGPLPVDEVVDTGIKIGKALAVAHRAGVLHRDIKPANIMISAYREPALGDFGIARIEGGHKTATGLVTASFAHAAPEVLEGQPPTAAADIYSLGSTIFELLTGKPPYFDPTDESIWPLMKRILSEPMPSPASVGMSPRLGTVFNRATARDTSQRYNDADQLVDALTDLASDPLALILDPPRGKPPSANGNQDDPTKIYGTDNGSGPGPQAGGARVRIEDLPSNKPDLTSLRRSDTELFAAESAIGSETAIGSVADGSAETEPVAAPATTMDLPSDIAAPAMGSISRADADRSAPGQRERPSRAGGFGFIVAAAVVAIAIAIVAGLFWFGPDSTGITAPSAAYEVIIRTETGLVANGPLRADETYQVEVLRLDGSGDVGSGDVGSGDAGSQTSGAVRRVLLDGVAVTDTGATNSPSFQATAGRHSVTVELDGEADPIVTNPVPVYVLGAPMVAEFRANLASVDIEQGWPVAIEVFDRLVEAGHENLQLVTTDDFPALTPGYWTLFVPGFGDDAEAAEQYCRDFDLDIPVDCYAGYLDPSEATN